MLKAAFDGLLARMVEVAKVFYGDRLVSVVVYGSVRRETMRQDSDVDVLIVARDLPRGRFDRVAEFTAVEKALTPAFQHLQPRHSHRALAGVQNPS